jgi:hypothetical protein
MALSASIATNFPYSSSEPDVSGSDNEPGFGGGPILLILRPCTVVEPLLSRSTLPSGLKLPLSEPGSFFSRRSDMLIFDMCKLSLGR